MDRLTPLFRPFHFPQQDYFVAKETGVLHEEVRACKP